MLAQLHAQGAAYLAVAMFDAGGSLMVMVGHESAEGIAAPDQMKEARRSQLQMAVNSGQAKVIHEIAMKRVKGFEALMTDVEKPNGSRALDYRVLRGKDIFCFTFIVVDGDLISRRNPIDSIMQSVRFTDSVDE
jgi:hypothetical protein